MTQSDPQTTSISNPFRTRILSGQITPLLTAKYLTTNELPLLCKTTSIHAIFIDMEHSAHDMRTVSQLILACHCAGISPVVRSPSKSHFHISRILDAGASAVVIPHVESVEEMWFKLGATWSLGGQDGAMVQAGMRQLSQKYEDINVRLERV
ncbi:4-hydroxy-2-oxovalerate aldolase [Aspergillus luchuensis]|uniref:4-hydroxy-2-oxovalerate aldolase n=1 Tax=Aspergillus kawachii TaxID=1069201 RepID=A0A146FFG9_ASPKA|nr:4-hydroxy-2-oxovalerate aldolase [Aspergillus luchuensis]